MYLAQRRLYKKDNCSEVRLVAEVKDIKQGRDQVGRGREHTAEIGYKH